MTMLSTNLWLETRLIGRLREVRTKKIKSKQDQDQSSRSGQLWGSGHMFPQGVDGGLYPVNGDAQRTPDVALQKRDFRYNLRDDKQKRRTVV